MMTANKAALIKIQECVSLFVVRRTDGPARLRMMQGRRPYTSSVHYHMVAVVPQYDSKGILWWTHICEEVWNVYLRSSNSDTFPSGPAAVWTADIRHASRYAALRVHQLHPTLPSRDTMFADMGGWLYRNDTPSGTWNGVAYFRCGKGYCVGLCNISYIRHKAHVTSTHKNNDF